MNGTVKRNPRTAWREYDGTTLVITPDDSMLHKLNSTGTFVWGLLGEHGVLADDLLKAMAQRFDGERETMQRDLEGFLEQLSSKGVVMMESPCGNHD